jgi:hypothetical protein
MKYVIAIAVAAFLSWNIVSMVGATAAISGSTGKTCTVCHVAAGKPELNKVGTCYKDAKDDAAKTACLH